MKSHTTRFTFGRCTDSINSCPLNLRRASLLFIDYWISDRSNKIFSDVRLNHRAFAPERAPHTRATTADGLSWCRNKSSGNHVRELDYHTHRLCATSERESTSFIFTDEWQLAGPAARRGRESIGTRGSVQLQAQRHDVISTLYALADAAGYSTCHAFVIPVNWHCQSNGLFRFSVHPFALHRRAHDYRF